MTLRDHQRSTLATFGLGLVAGVIGNSIMTGYQTLVQKIQAAQSDGEEESGGSGWKDAPAPAQVAGKAIKAVTGTYPNRKHIPLATNAMHWGYGVTWGGVYGLAESRFRAHPAVHGAMLGATLWGMAYAQLVPLGIYEPPWEYPAKDLGVDLSYHLVYGFATAFAFDQIAR